MAQLGVGDPAQGTTYTLASVTAVVLGGTSLFGGRGSFIATLLGAALVAADHQRDDVPQPVAGLAVLADRPHDAGRRCRLHAGAARRRASHDTHERTTQDVATHRPVPGDLPGDAGLSGSPEDGRLGAPGARGDREALRGRLLVRSPAACCCATTARRTSTRSATSTPTRTRRRSTRCRSTRSSATGICIDVGRCGAARVHRRGRCSTRRSRRTGQELRPRRHAADAHRDVRALRRHARVHRPVPGARREREPVAARHGRSRSSASTRRAPTTRSPRPTRAT